MSNTIAVIVVIILGLFADPIYEVIRWKVFKIRKIDLEKYIRLVEEFNDVSVLLERSQRENARNIDNIMRLNNCRLTALACVARSLHKDDENGDILAAHRILATGKCPEDYKRAASNSAAESEPK